MKLNIVRGILILLLLGTFNIIFDFSAQDAPKSSSISTEVSKAIINIFNKNDSEENKTVKAKNLEPVIRKLAHFSIYTVVGFLLMALVSTYNLQNRKRFMLSLIIGFIYA